MSDPNTTLVQWHTEDPETHVVTWHEVGETGDYKKLLTDLKMPDQYDSLLAQGVISEAPKPTEPETTAPVSAQVKRSAQPATDAPSTTEEGS